MFKLISPFEGTHTIWLAPMIRFPHKWVQSDPDTQLLPDSNTFTEEMQNKQHRNMRVGSQNEGCDGSHLPFFTQELFCLTYRTTFNI